MPKLQTVAKTSNGYQNPKLLPKSQTIAEITDHYWNIKLDVEIPNLLTVYQRYFSSWNIIIAKILDSKFAKIPNCY